MDRQIVRSIIGGALATILTSTGATAQEVTSVISSGLHWTESRSSRRAQAAEWAH
jgi:hypothetical protein